MALIAPINVGSDWVDLYAASSITVGTQVAAQVLYSRSDVFFSDSASTPTDNDGRVGAARLSFHRNDAGDAGLWARCATSAQITLQEI